MTRSKEMTDKYIIKNATLRADDYLFFLSVLILLFFIIKGQHTELIVVIFIGLLGFTTYRTLKRLQDRSDKIIIDKNGIKICETDNLIKWSKINYAYIKQKSEGVGRNTKVVDFFHIDTKEGEIRLRMSEFAYKQDLLVQAVENFSGKNIGELTDLLGDKAEKIIGSNKNTYRISKIFTDFYKRQIHLALILLFTLIGISIYLQIVIDFPYVFAIGFAMTFGFIHLIGIYEERRLRNQPYMHELDDKKYKTLKKEYGKGHDLEMSKGKKIASVIFLIFIVLGVFGLSYMFDKESEKRNSKKIEQINSLPNNV